MAIKANLIIDQGTTYSTDLQLTDDAGNVIDLTSYTAAAQIRKTYTSSSATNFTVTIGASTGLVTLSLTANQTSNITAGRYVYDVELTSAGGVVSRIIEGIVTVTPQVTQ